jgi:hypothetical protein
MTRNTLRCNGHHTVHSVHTLCVFLYRGVGTAPPSVVALYSYFEN